MTFDFTYITKIEASIAWFGIGEVLLTVLWVSSNSDKRIAEKCSPSGKERQGRPGNNKRSKNKSGLPLF
jgi:hypothetical protein